LASEWETEADFTSGASDTIDETDEQDADYSFSSSRLKIGKRINADWKYLLMISQGNRDYEEDDDEFDNSKFIVGNKLKQISETDKEKNSLAIDLEYQNKSFENSPEDTYNRLKAKVTTSWERKDSHRISISTGVSDVRYANSTKEGEDNYEAKAGFRKNFFDRNFIIDGYSRVISSTRATFGTHVTNKLGTETRLNLPHFELIRCSVKFGFRNSRTDEDTVDSDVNYDYYFQEFKNSTRHPLAKRVNLNTSLTSFLKKYIEESYDNCGYETGLSIKSSPLPNFYIKPGYTYREKSYSRMKSLSHFKNLYYVTVGYREKSQWGISSKLSKSFYQFPDSIENDKMETKISVELDKYIDDDSSIYLRGQHRYKDYEEDLDLALSTWKFGINHKW
jgi:hypothetical protein